MAPKKGFGMPPSVFLNNRERVGQELTAAYRRLSETSFFSARPNALNSVFSAAGANINAAWAAIVLAKWVDSVGRPL